VSSRFSQRSLRKRFIPTDVGSIPAASVKNRPAHAIGAGYGVSAGLEVGRRFGSGRGW
jgi:hypothetical protein